MLTPMHPSPTASFSQTEGPAEPELRSAAARGTVGDTASFPLQPGHLKQSTASLLYHEVFLTCHATELEIIYDYDTQGEGTEKADAQGHVLQVSFCVLPTAS